MFPDVPEFNFPADISHFDFDPSPINQSIFLADTSVQPDLNPSPINQRAADVSNDNSIGTPSNNLPLRESTDIYIYIYIYIFFFFSMWVFFHEHSRSTGLQEKGEGISLTPHYHLHPLHRHLDISRAITAESSPLHIVSSRTRTGNLWFPSASR